MSGNGGFVTVARLGDIPEGGVRVARVGETEIAVFHVDGAYHALEDVCTHDGGPLAEGALEGHEIECPRHGARFDVRTGAVTRMPATAAVPRWVVRVFDGEIQVAPPGTPAGESATPPINRHTGQPYPAGELDATTFGAGAAFAADAANAPGGQSSVRRAAEAAPSAAPAATPQASGAAPSQQELAIRSALETVMDPEIGLSVIDLGLIREVLFLTDPSRTHVRMMLTTPFCPYAPQLVAEVKQAAESVVPQVCDVELMPDPWSPDLMPDPGLLGYSF